MIIISQFGKPINRNRFSCEMNTALILTVGYRLHRHRLITHLSHANVNCHLQARASRIFIIFFSLFLR